MTSGTVLEPFVSYYDKEDADEYLSNHLCFYFLIDFFWKFSGWVLLKGSFFEESCCFALTYFHKA